MYMSRQGILWQGEWRHRLENGQYYIKLAGIDQDATDLPSAIADRDQYDGWRGSIETKGLFSLASWWHFGWDVTAATDDTFRRFYKLDNILATDVVNRVFLNGISERNYFGLEAYHFISQQFTGMAQVDRLASRYAHPMLDYNYVVADPLARRRAPLEHQRAELLQQSGSDGARAARQRHRADEPRCHRARLAPRFIDPIGITYTPFAQLRGDIYQMSDYVDPQDPTGRCRARSLARGLALAA